MKRKALEHTFIAEVMQHGCVTSRTGHRGVYITIKSNYSGEMYIHWQEMGFGSNVTKCDTMLTFSETEGC